MMPFRSTKILLVFSVFAVVFSVAAYVTAWFLFSQKQSSISDVYAERAELAMKKYSDENIKILLKETEEKRSRLDNIFVNNGNKVSLLEEIAKTGNYAGVKTSIVTVEEEKDTGALKIAAEAHGTFSGCVGFLSLLQSLPRPISVTRASVSRDESGVWNGVFEMKVLQLKNNI